MRKSIFYILLFIGLFSRAQQKPNVVFIISDQHKLKETGAYGNKLSITPNIDALAKTGVVFNNAYTPAPVCAPARASLITGMYPYANGAIYHKAPVKMPNGKIKNIGSGYLRETGYHEDIVTLAAIFKQQDYVTASPGKMHVHGELQKDVDEDHKEGNNMGFDEVSLRYYTYFPGGHYQDEVGEDTYMRYRQFKKYSKVYHKGSMHLNENYEPTLVKNEEDNFDMVVAKKSVEFINKRAEDGKNFFLHIGFEKPHAPFTTTQRYLDMHTPANFPLPKTFNDWHVKGKYPWVPNWIHSAIPKDLQKAQNVMAAYNACITEMDDMVGRVVNALKENGLYENTIIIYTTDHGEHLFEHGLRGKHNMYEAAVNIPFIISYPKLFKQNTRNNSLISFIDLMPTLAELINGSTPETAQGVSLVEVLTQGKELKSRVVYSEFRGGNYELLAGAKNVPSRMMRKGDYKFIYTHGIINQLYNLKEDPDELNNLIFDEKYQKIYQDMYFQTLAKWRFQEYAPIPVSLKNNKLKWNQTEEFTSYAIYYSLTNDAKEATLLAANINDDYFKVKKEGYYWLLATPKLSKTSKFYGENIPVAVGTYSFNLPVSNAIYVKN
ncbi:sulfatase-like hydrolase/transferase [Tenacibaculum tangerinum]|uniref:Sulfatase-like hydrolase/transferase n=1 Tax=Tenacibaculum tangerinum TaxID=3038772 RepID=A0ABY8L0I0_9FLAO|nr:sulfatase-like hydrolase/transferase [Tenacibaculum tangerinum]WGH74982.1 sulfatase-like hydrolase/transferase [Tenacibaculum tangerinum]